MYVCLCKAITDKQIKDAAFNGASSMRCLNKELGVATQCGKCAVTAKQILREHHSQVTQFDPQTTPSFVDATLGKALK
ncbi:MAG: bacterioferritin-associated ferredoxin [Kangiella sp.]|jgi:bacterioferritin-associated ferredoxin|uniref:bacterioferritin-associated ferredoxin n=1 Tax=Kangiella sp. TaxID=1920245 RepID=UPI002A155E4A|nr:bacterioferritin-associated ferredoxin [Kangiella sp.]MCW9028909.1 bacterioferritin-associated ferredoxin [Kangiella sp.]